MTSPAASGRHLSRFEQRPKMPCLTALFSLSLMQCHRHLQISRAKNIDSVVERGASCSDCNFLYSDDIIYHSLSVTKQRIIVRNGQLFTSPSLAYDQLRLAGKKTSQQRYASKVREKSYGLDV